MRYVLGVDGGATKTHALIVEETGRAAGFGSGRGSNYQMCGMPRAEREIGGAVETALNGAGITAQDVELGYLCLAGADLAEDYAVLERHMAGLNLARNVVVKNDTMAALGAGLTRPWGIAVICGTGLNAVGRAPDGREISFPSLGWISGDWGGGGDLSQDVIRLVMRAWDGRGAPTALSRMVLRKLGAGSEDELLQQLRHNRVDETRLHSVVPLLFEAALAGDEVARGLVIRMGEEVAAAARALIRRLALADRDVEVVLAGSIFKGKGPLLLETVTRSVQAEAPLARISRVRYEPVVGAAILALGTIAVAVDGPVAGLLDSSAEALGLRLARETG